MLHLYLTTVHEDQEDAEVGVSKKEFLHLFSQSYWAVEKGVFPTANYTFPHLFPQLDEKS
jgi:hypothetical protein